MLHGFLYEQAGREVIRRGIGKCSRCVDCLAYQLPFPIAFFACPRARSEDMHLFHEAPSFLRGGFVLYKFKICHFEMHGHHLAQRRGRETGIDARKVVWIEGEAAEVVRLRFDDGPAEEETQRAMRVYALFGADFERDAARGVSDERGGHP